MMFSWLLDAGLAGGVVILLWELSYPLSGRFFKSSWHYAVLKAAAFFMLFPSGLLKGLVKTPDLPIVSEITGYITVLSYEDAALAADGGAGFSPKIPQIAAAVWLAGAVFTFAGEILKAHKFKRRILSLSESRAVPDIEAIFRDCKKQLKVRRDVTLRTSDCVKTPLVFGLFKPCAVFPSSGMSHDE
jgi:beta-lactamase regulating signal transducer with metallopeptidase domain